MAYKRLKLKPHAALIHNATWLKGSEPKVCTNNVDNDGNGDSGWQR